MNLFVQGKIHLNQLETQEGHFIMIMHWPDKQDCLVNGKPHLVAAKQY